MYCWLRWIWPASRWGRGRSYFRADIGAGAIVVENLDKTPGLLVLSPEHLGQETALLLDPTKVTVNVRQLGLTGQQVELILWHKYGIQVELSDLYNVPFIVGPGNTKQDIAALTSAFAGCG